MRLIVFLILLVSCGQIDSEVKIKAHRSLRKVMPNPPLLHDAGVKAKRLRKLGKKIMRGKFSVALAEDYRNLLHAMVVDIRSIEADFQQERERGILLLTRQRRTYSFLPTHMKEWVRELKREFYYNVYDVSIDINNIVTQASYRHQYQLKDVDLIILEKLIRDIRSTRDEIEQVFERLAPPSSRSPLSPLREAAREAKEAIEENYKLQQEAYERLNKTRTQGVPTKNQRG